MNKKVLYSFSKTGFELDYWNRELDYKDSNITIIPFNHGKYIDASCCLRAQKLDDFFYKRDKYLFRLYESLKVAIEKNNIDCLIVDNANPYHPEFLYTLDVHKILRTSDGPLAAYDRDIPYYHAFDTILYHSPAFSAEIDMKEKLSYCGVKDKYLWPMCSFEKLRSKKSKKELFSFHRDVDVAFVGALFPNKMPLLASVKKEFGKNFRLHGLASWKKNLYFNVMYNFPGVVKSINFNDYIPLYERVKIGINIHNRGKYTVGGYRLFDLPANGIMQISDGSEYLEEFFKVGVEIESYESSEELIDKINFYLKNVSAREKIAKAGFDRVMKDHTIKSRLHKLAKYIK
jgi:spore maturation protein CgeB